MLDPQVADYSTGVPVMMHPDIVEEKLNTMKKMASFSIQQASLNKNTSK